MATKSKARTQKALTVPPPAPKKAKIASTKVSSLISDDIVRKLFETIEEGKDEIITLKGRVQRVYTAFGGALLLQLFEKELKEKLFKGNCEALPAKEGTMNYPWTVEGEVATIKLSKASASKFTFEQIFEALKDETNAYGYGKEGAVVQVFCQARTYKDLPTEGTYGISVKIYSPIVLLEEAPDEISVAPPSPQCKSYDFEFCLHESRVEEAGEEFAELMKRRDLDHLDYLLSLPSIHHDGDINFFCE